VTAILDGRGPSVSIDPDGSGKYVIDDVPAGPHTVEFFTEPCAVYTTEFLGGASSVPDAQQVDVSAGLTTTGVDASLQLAPPPATSAGCNAGPPAATAPLPTPPGPPPTAPASRAATGLSIATRSVELSSGDIAAIAVVCWSASCHGTAALRLAAPSQRTAATRQVVLRLIGNATFSSKTAGQTIARVHLSHAGLRLIRAARGRAAVRVTLTAVEAGRHESRTAIVVVRTHGTA
jgi:hypothetical protein